MPHKENDSRTRRRDETGGNRKSGRGTAAKNEGGQGRNEKMEQKDGFAVCSKLFCGSLPDRRRGCGLLPGRNGASSVCDGVVWLSVFRGKASEKVKFFGVVSRSGFCRGGGSRSGYAAALWNQYVTVVVCGRSGRGAASFAADRKK